MQLFEINTKKLDAEITADFKKSVAFLTGFAPNLRDRIKKRVNMTDADCSPAAQVIGGNFFEANLERFGYDPSTAANYLSAVPPVENNHSISGVLEKYRRHGSISSNAPKQDTSSGIPTWADRMARQAWAADFGLSVGEKYQKNDRGHWCLGTLAYAINKFNELWAKEFPVAA